MTKHLKPYYFIETRYPEQDPNIDLNFENDILYGALLNDELDKYNTPNAILPEIPPYKSEPKHSIKKDDENVTSFNRIYIVFILIVILLVLLWYIYGTDHTKKNPSAITTYADQPEMTMMSPDVGLGTRYVINNPKIQ
jgi:hypothetical protein